MKREISVARETNSVVCEPILESVLVLALFFINFGEESSSQNQEIVESQLFSLVSNSTQATLSITS